MTRTALVVLFLAASATAGAQTPRSGEQVYQTTCVACHGQKVEKSPQLGDRKAWAKLIGEGQMTLTVDGYFGVRTMPPRGGNADLSLEEFARAVAFMARAAGAGWKDPDAKMLERMKAAEKKRLDAAKAKKS